MAIKLAVVVGACTKYASNTVYHGETPSDDLPDDVKWGLGGALPIVFAEQGYDVVVMSRSLANLAPIEAHITGTLHKRCFAVECDCADRASIARAFAAVAERFGSIDVLVYNAGYA
jgi:NAD(P)-dependent dehydrogenase (short-subunit alcohol dehydrogenase family)